MINSEKFVVRLQKVMEFYGETASSFADKIDVQRSSISHILSGRNKPSLDFVLKVLGSYPEVDLYWLMNGKGKFPSDTKTALETASNSPKKTELQKTSDRHLDAVQKSASKKSIDRIIIFYTDGTFDHYDPQ